MADGRKNNGNKGHSTKAKRPDDKRINKGRQMLEKYLNEEFNDSKFSELMNKLYQKGLEGDTRAASLFLSYVLGKPKETKDITSNGETINVGSIQFFDTDSDK